MRFPDAFLDDIRDRLRISEIIGQRVAFDKKKTNAAKGDYWGCCPFHGEKTPSFHCEDRKGRYYCFGCGASGDHFRFLTELDGLNFAEAVERLASQAGLPMPVMDKREQEREEQRKSLYDVMALAAKFYREQLHEAGGAEARSYLRGRGLSAMIQQEFDIGFAPNSRNALKQYLADQGVEAAQMEACGLVVSGEGIAVSYDRFRGRIMFPIQDSRGRTIAFGGRALDPDAKAKYLNSPETELFKKSNVLYNFAKARSAIHSSGDVIVAEGYMDVIALYAHGVRNAVAPLGTALTESHLRTLWKVSERPTLCFDGDSAGKRAAARTVDIALPNLVSGRTLRFLEMPEGLDPDDFLRQRGVGEFKTLFDDAMPLHEMVLERHLAGQLLDTPEQKAKFEQMVMQDIGLIKDPGVQKYYRSHQRMRLYELFGMKFAANNNRKDHKAVSEIAKKLRDDHGSKIVQLLLGMCVEYPGIIREYIEEIALLRFSDNHYNSFVQGLYALYVEYEELAVSTIYERLGEEFHTVLEAVHGSEKITYTEIKSGTEKVKYVSERGHVLFRNFPVLKRTTPSASTLRVLAQFLISKVWDQIAEAEFQAAKNDINTEPEFLIALAEDRRHRELDMSQVERDLDEEFQALRSSGMVLAA